MSTPGYAPAPGYAGIATQSFLDADAVNGKTMTPSGEYYPSLSNGQLAALVRAWKRAAARSSDSRWPQAYELTIAALGWHKEGDRFVMTKEHAMAPASPELLEFYWQATSHLADRLDATSTKLAPIPVDWTYPGYEAAAREAWTQMQMERARGAAATPEPGPVTSSAPEPAPASGGGWIIAILLAIAAGSKRKA